MILMHLVLPDMKERKMGCIINIASRSTQSCIFQLMGRAGTVSGPLSVHYYSGKAALIRATGCIQSELDLQGYDNIHLYALHPGGCRTDLQSISRLVR
jgi:short-subunit dehydrogenase